MLFATLRSAAMQRWEHFAHVADIGVRGHGDTLAAAFAAAALGLTAVVVDPARVRAQERVGVACSAADLEVLFYDWLNAVVLQMATQRMLFSRFDVRVEGGRLMADLYGEPVDVARHAPAVEVKGATFTELAVRREPDGSWLAQCVLDV